MNDRRYGGYALAVLTATNLLNYLERNAIFALFEPVKRDLGLTDGQLGWLGTAYVLVFSLAALPLGLLGDLRSRRGVIAGGIALWSLGTALSGLAMGFTSLFVARALVGFGGAAAAAASASMVADYFSGHRRALAMGIFMSGLAVGGVLGILIAFSGARGIESWLRSRLPFAPTDPLIRWEWWVAGACLAAVLFLGTLAGLLPAWRAARMVPMEAIRADGAGV